MFELVYVQSLLLMLIELALQSKMLVNNTNCLICKVSFNNNHSLLLIHYVCIQLPFLCKLVLKALKKWENFQYKIINFLVSILHLKSVSLMQINFSKLLNIQIFSFAINRSQFNLLKFFIVTSKKIVNL